METREPLAQDPKAMCERLRRGLGQNPRDYEWRINQLRALKKMLLENDALISSAMFSDLRKSPFECQATEQGVVLAEIDDALRNLKRWMRPQRVSTPLYNQPGRSHIYREPYGLALVIGAWNYPVNLTLAPLVAAIAGGNAVVIKPSEISASTAKVIGDLIPRYLDPELFAVFQAGAQGTDALLDEKFDTIFFTGSSKVGQIILQKAAVHLTPATLELGGKSPAIVMNDANLKVTARRLAWAKFMNAGQTCVAPDFLLVQSAIRIPFIEELKKALVEFYGDRAIEGPDYCRIVNLRNFDRLKGLCEGETILHGGDFNRDKLFISPTLFAGKKDSPLMGEEIFGPLLPIIEMETKELMVEFINSRPKPLALYFFGRDKQAARYVEHATSSGAFVVNDAVIHMPIPQLPFGGVGASGMGNYHGRFGFETFTHAKGVLYKSFWFDVPIRYPPYADWKAKVLRWLFS